MSAPIVSVEHFPHRVEVVAPDSKTWRSQHRALAREALGGVPVERARESRMINRHGVMVRFTTWHETPASITRRLTGRRA